MLPLTGTVALKAGRRPTVQLNATSVVVKPGIAAEQMRKDSAPSTSVTPTSSAAGVLVRRFLLEFQPTDQEPRPRSSQRHLSQS